MSAGPTDIGITSLGTCAATRVSTTKKVETKVRKLSDGTFAEAAAFDPTGSFDVSGEGDTPSLAVGILTDSALIPSVFTGGKVVAKTLSENQKSDGYPTWKYSADWLPGAS